MKCDICEYKTSCIVRLTIPNIHGCPDGTLRCKVSTNADRIRSMSDKELAEFLAKHDLALGDNNLPMPDDWLEWLQSPLDVASEAEEISVRS